MLDWLRVCVLVKYYGIFELKGNWIDRLDRENFGVRKLVWNFILVVWFLKIFFELVMRGSGFLYKLSILDVSELKIFLVMEFFKNGNFVICEFEVMKFYEVGLWILLG